MRTAPSPATIRRVLIALAPHTLAALTSPDTLHPVSVDGKSLRGSASPTSAAVHLPAALTPDRHLLTQVRVAAGTSEVDALASPLADVDLTGGVVTADALHTQTATAAHLVEKLHAHYVLTVKRNQRSLFDQLTTLPWAQAPTLDTTRNRGHGRAETRTGKVPWTCALCGDLALRGPG